MASPWRSKAERASDREAERESKREAVLRTAAQVFNERGFQAATLDEVAARLNVTKPTLYYYVNSKDEILFECVHKGLELLQQAIADVKRQGGSAFEQLQAAMRQYVDIVTMDFGMCVIRVGEDPLPPENRARLRRMKAELDAEFRHLVAQGVAEGSIAPCDPKLTAFMIAGALSWIGRWYRPDGGLSPAAIADQLIPRLCLGLSPLPTSSTPPTPQADSRAAAAPKSRRKMA